jgi:hypothetical protein
MGQRSDGNLRLHCTWDVVLLLVGVHLLDGRWRQRQLLWGVRQWRLLNRLVAGLAGVPLRYVVVVVVIPGTRGLNR